jgi:hypothetical protein
MKSSTIIFYIWKAILFLSGIGALIFLGNWFISCLNETSLLQMFYKFIAGCIFLGMIAIIGFLSNTLIDSIKEFYEEK